MKMPFGKYKGEYIVDLPTDYLEWIINEVEDEKINQLAYEEYDRRKYTNKWENL